jgi:hypothetical protein
MRRAVWLAALAASACSKTEPPAPASEVEAITIDAAHAVVRAGKIGQRDNATYVFVDVSNKSAEDRLVTVDGTLEGGAVLHGSQQRVPAGATRTVALVADAVVDGAAKPTLHVAHAPAATYPEMVEVQDPKTTRVDDKLIATGFAHNTTDKAANVVVCATFYGADGAILTRPFSATQLDPGERRVLRFEGPKEAERAVVFVADVAFP